MPPFYKWDSFQRVLLPNTRAGCRNNRTTQSFSSCLTASNNLFRPLYWANIRNTGVVGYALVSPIVFLLLGKVFGGAHQSLEESERILATQTGVH